MQRDPLLHPDADGGDLVLAAFAFFRPADPNANAVVAPLCVNAEGGEGLYDPFFQGNDKTTDIRAATFEVKHHIDNPLPRPVIRHLSPSAALVQRKARV